MLSLTVQCVSYGRVSCVCHVMHGTGKGLNMHLSTYLITDLSIYLYISGTAERNYEWGGGGNYEWGLR